MLRILVALDGSNHSRRVVTHALQMRDDIKGGLDVLLLNVQPPVPVRELLLDGRPSELEHLEQPLRARGAQVLDPSLAALRSAGIEARAHAELGDPAEVIARFAATHHCELIMMGTRGVSAIAAVCLGSVATRVLHFTSIPVLLVP